LFHAKNFGKIPVKLVGQVLKQTDQEKQNIINAHSVSTAQLCTLVVGALAGKQAKAKVDDFLPFQRRRDFDGLSEQTKAAIQWALKNKTMPPVIIGMLGAELNG